MTKTGTAPLGAASGAEAMTALGRGVRRAANRTRESCDAAQRAERVSHRGRAFAGLRGADRTAAGLAAGLVAAAALTDLLDGIAARALGKVSSSSFRPGRRQNLHPDGALAVWGEGVIRGADAWAALIVLWREIVISALGSRPVTRVAARR